ncbi:MAG: phosphatidate cytidylyltransferase, partial [Treponema sp.]|nr:phosphatidate cytidylyltransferase [Treponema sp.]
MNVKKLIARLAVFFIGLPLIAALVLFLPQYNHLAINVAAVIFSALGAVEFAAILKKKNLSLPLGEAVFLGAAAPAAMTAVVSFGVPILALPALMAAGASWILISRVFSPEKKLENFMGRTAAGFAVLIYPGLFMSWIVRLSFLPKTEIIILTFLISVFANDSLAWTTGMLFGKGNRGIIPASPNKSIAGFIGGFATSALVGFLGALLFPEAFSPRFPALPSGLILGLATGIAGSLGDLGESAIKRSANIKDSGFLIPGRGGV